MSNLINGVYVVGQLKGFTQTPWTNDPNKFNYSIGVSTSSYVNEWGETNETIQRIDIQSDDVSRVMNFTNENKGSIVQIPVVYRARTGGRSGSWLSCFMPKNSELKLLKKHKEAEPA